MRRIDLFFQNILVCIDNILVELDNYYNANQTQIDLSESKSTKYADFNTELNSSKDTINDLLTNRNELIENFNFLDDFLSNYNNFIGTFPDFPINNITFIKYWLLIANRINTVKEVDLELNANLDINHFKIIDLEENIIEDNFLNYNADMTKSQIIFTFNETIESFMINEIHSAHVDLLLIWLNTLSIDNTEENKQFVFMCIENQPVLKDLISILKIQVLINGKLIKSLEKYEIEPNKPFLNDLDFTEKYIQFDNISNILNEYNNQKYLLDKFLKLYHIIENFMYKQKVCKLQRERLGSPLQIRDFQTLYDRFSSNESSSIQEFFSNVFSINYDANTFEVLIKNEWNQLEVLDPTKPTEIDTLFNSLALKSNYNYNNLKTNINGAMFANIVYKIRNSIVHNKDSETHFESTNLPSGAKFILEKFFIPNLERIVYHLIINKNEIVWYDNDKLLLYHT